MRRGTLLRSIKAWCGACMVSALASPELSAQFRISELLFNPPGDDFAAEAVELLGPPNALFTNATYLVFIEGDAGGVPGTIQNVFELSGARIGGNGFLLLLQKASPYAANPDATLRQNSGSDAGWGDGSGSSIAHRGEADQLDLENGSFSCLLIESLIEPDPGDSIDADGNGVPDGMATNWTILDSIGMLDDGGPGDISYAALTFRRNPAAQALGSVVEVDFRPGYLARQGNTPGSSPGDWLAGDVLAGALPDWVLGSGPNTAPPHVAGSPLDHWGGPNFGAPNLPGIILIPPAQAIPEGGQASMTLRLNTAPASPVLLRLASDVEVHMSLDGSSFFSVLDVHLPDTNAVEILVGAVDDTDVETSPHASAISLQMQVPSPPEYPLEMPLPDPRVSIEENDKLLISELNVNPPGTDASREYLEIVGLPGALLDGVYLLVVEGDMNDDPGTVDLLLDLSGVQVGSNGFLLVLAPDHPYTVPPLAGIHLDPALSTGGGVFPNGSVTFMLITTTDPPALDDDLDKGDNGVLEGLAEDVQILDAVGWTDGDPDDLVFAETVINLAESTPDAAMRMGSNTWFRGSLGGGGDPLTFTGLSDGLYSLGTRLTPGETNRVGPRIVPLVPLSGVIGDPGNPGTALRLLDVGLLQGGLSFTSFSNASNVVPAANIQVQAISNDHFAVLLDPVGVGYAAVTVRVSDVSSYVDLPLSYAASDPGRPGAFWLTHASDASAALAIDQAYMLVGDDEGQAIRMYPRDRSGSPVTEFDLNPFLALTDFEDGQAREVDIEGVTRSGNQVYWLGSHSHAEIGELRTNRWRLVATELSGQGADTVLTYLGHYEHLRSDLIAWDASNGHGRGVDYLGFSASAAAGVLPKSSDGSGFNMEAFAMAPDTTNTAYLCFRTPLVPATNRAFACIVPLANLQAVATGGGGPGAAEFGQPILLDLGCRGIRSMEGDTNGFLMVAGEVDNRRSTHAFRFFTWTGYAADRPIEYSGDLSGLNPEAIVALPSPPWSPSSEIQVLSDNGRSIYYNDNITAKLLTEPAFKKFRLDAVPLGVPVVPSARIRAFDVDADGAGLTWCGPTGRVYRVQSSLEMSVPDWLNLSGPIFLAHPVNRYEWQPDSTAIRFFRVLDTGAPGP